MAEYTELIKALRCCCPQPQETCDGCSYDTAGECNVGRMMLDAAAAIESLQAKVKDAFDEGYNFGYMAGIGCCSFKRAKQPPQEVQE